MQLTPSYFSLRTWMMIGLVGVLATACGGDGEGRDSILGTEGNSALPPVVTAVSPADGAVGVPIDVAAVTATFNEPVAAGDTSFTVTCAGLCTNPAGTVTFELGRHDSQLCAGRTVRTLDDLYSNRFRRNQSGEQDWRWRKLSPGPSARSPRLPR
ncbi:MAG: Ig-like domain-containing protein [Gammaproteobacteria bacterium]|nr:Ig-like domain-containing protein [Gammaproteobacteria bacterium]